MFRGYGRRFGKIAELEFTRKTMNRTREDNLLITRLETLSNKFAENVARLRAGTDPLSNRVRAAASAVDKAVTAVNELIGATFL